MPRTHPRHLVPALLARNGDLMNNEPKTPLHAIEVPRYREYYIGGPWHGEFVDPKRLPSNAYVSGIVLYRELDQPQLPPKEGVYYRRRFHIYGIRMSMFVDEGLPLDESTLRRILEVLMEPHKLEIQIDN